MFPVRSPLAFPLSNFPGFQRGAQREQLRTPREARRAIENTLPAVGFALVAPVPQPPACARVRDRLAWLPCSSLSRGASFKQRKVSGSTVRLMRPYVPSATPQLRPIWHQSPDCPGLLPTVAHAGFADGAIGTLFIPQSFEPSRTPLKASRAPLSVASACRSQRLNCHQRGNQSCPPGAVAPWHLIQGLHLPSSQSWHAHPGTRCPGLSSLFHGK